ncbi:hypothetical protein [Paraburkholderia sediminicola]|uniref:hypothetical protein n=1 Tax=Paraburkholderia sediminicola TaxID=458836 RepID=UPI0038BB6849
MRLLDFCIAEYLRRKDSDKADVFAWLRFEPRPVAEAFTALMDVAKTTGRYDLTRGRALKHMWEFVRTEEAPTKTKRSHWQTPSRTELVKVFLAERESETAWEAFCGGPVAVNMWATMAAVRARTHPHDAIALYHRLLPMAAENGTRNARYDEAVGIVRAIGRLRAELSEQAQFATELDEIRKAYRAKRNFIKLLAAFQ